MSVAANGRKRISVIIPARNERAQIGGVVKAAVNAALRAENGSTATHLDHTRTEVLVVDNGSTDGTGQVVAELKRSHGVRVLHCPALARRVPAMPGQMTVTVRSSSSSTPIPGFLFTR